MAFSIISILILYLTCVFGKLLDLLKFFFLCKIGIIGLYFDTHKINSHLSFCSSPSFHLAYFYFPYVFFSHLSSHITYAFPNAQACYSRLCSGFPVLPMQFPLSTLSWEYGQGQSLIIQEDFKCFHLSVKVECWNQESLSGCYFNQTT